MAKDLMRKYSNAYQNWNMLSGRPLSYFPVALHLSPTIKINKATINYRIVVIINVRVRVGIKISTRVQTSLYMI